MKRIKQDLEVNIIATALHANKTLIQLRPNFIPEHFSPKNEIIAQGITKILDNQFIPDLAIISAHLSRNKQLRHQQRGYASFQNLVQTIAERKAAGKSPTKAQAAKLERLEAYLNEFPDIQEITSSYTSWNGHAQNLPFLLDQLANEHARSEGIAKLEELMKLLQDPSQDPHQIRNEWADSFRVKPRNALMVTETATERQKRGQLAPEAVQICGPLLYRNTVTIWYSGPKRYKTTWAYMLANAAARGEGLFEQANGYYDDHGGKHSHILPNYAGAMKVLFIDFEMSERQFFDRTALQGDAAQLSENLYMMSCSKEVGGLDKNYYTQRLEEIRQEARRIQPGIIIMDNITTMLPDPLHEHETAVKIMSYLKALKTENNCTVLALAHTPKNTGDGEYLDASTLKGASYFQAVVEDMVTFGKSQYDDEKLYVKQIYCRSKGITIGRDNVLVYRGNAEGKMLTVQEYGFQPEADLIGKNPTLFSDIPDMSDESLVSQCYEDYQTGTTIADCTEWLHSNGHRNWSYKKLSRLLRAYHKEKNPAWDERGVIPRDADFAPSSLGDEAPPF